MSIMQQSSRAQDRTLGVWFQNIQQGHIKLPRFQRFEAWDRGRIASFLNTIINNLPVGVTLALEVAGTEKFESRYIATSEPKSNGPVTQHLLDGQQRLTAFWRSVHNNYEWETFFVYLPQLDRGETKSGTDAEIRCIPRWVNKNQLRVPLWVEGPAKCLERGLLPVSLLRPEDISLEVDEWVNEATKPLKPLPTDPDAFAKLEAFNETKERIKKEVTILRERVKFFNLPYLSLPAETSKDVALQVFINMNTNSKPIRMQISDRAVILKLGAEGGGLCLEGVRIPSGWCYRLNYNDSTPQLIDQEAINESTGWLPDLATALAICRWPWNHLYPLYIHLDFSDQIMAIKSALDRKQRSPRPNRAIWLGAISHIDKYGKEES